MQVCINVNSSGKSAATHALLVDLKPREPAYSMEQHSALMTSKFYRSMMKGVNLQNSLATPMTRKWNLRVKLFLDRSTTAISGTELAEMGDKPTQTLTFLREQPSLK